MLLVEASLCNMREEEEEEEEEKILIKFFVLTDAKTFFNLRLSKKETGTH